MNGLQLKITMRGSKPPVWRRIQLPASLTFDDLHTAIQELFGWMNYHLYEFRFPHQQLRIIDTSMWDDDFPFLNMETLNAEDTLLTPYLQEGTRLVYTYDMGDNWEHDILVEKEVDMRDDCAILMKWKGDNYAEDAGNIFGYEEIVQIANDKKHSEHKQMQEWLEMQHTPFDEEMVQTALTCICIDEDIIELPEVFQTKLDDLLFALMDTLNAISIDEIAMVTIEKDDTRMVIAISEVEDNYTLQIYDDEKSFFHGIELVSENTHFNVFANALLIVLTSDETALLSTGHMSACGFVKRLKTGYLPLDITKEEITEVLDKITLLIDSLQHVQHLPSYQKQQSLHLSYEQLAWSADIKSISDIIPIECFHCSSSHLKKLQKKNMYPHDVHIDIISIPDQNFTSNSRMRIMFVMEDEINSLEKEIDKHAFTTFETLNEAVLDLFYEAIESFGIMQKVSVNNENMEIMLKGVCEDLKIPLSIDNFVTQLEQEFQSEGMQQNIQYLDMLANMSEAEFNEMVSLMTPQEYAQFKQFMDDLDIQIEEDDDTLFDA